MQLKPTHKYDDIIHLPHPVSQRHPGMPISDRAAQFSPFSALTGYDAVIAETGRLTDEATELTESAISQLSDTLKILDDNAHLQMQVSVTYFQPDIRKTGGSLLSVTGRVKRVDTYEQVLRLTDGREIPFEAIKAIKCPLI